MELINPVKLTTDSLFGSTIPENDYPFWNSTVAYVVGNRVIILATHKVYECTVNNTNLYPPDNISVATPSWIEVGYTNRYKMIDDKYGTQTVGTGSFSATFNLGSATPDSVSVLNAVGSSIRIVSTVDGNTIFDQTLILAAGVDSVVDWYSYFFGALGSKIDTMYVNTIPPIANQIITITVNGVGTVAIGNLVIGKYVHLGNLLMRPKIGIISYSRKDVNAFGDTVVVPRAFAKRFTAQFVFDNALLDETNNVLAAVRDTPCVWLGLGNTYTSMIVWGFYKDYEISLEYETESICDITIEGLI